MSVHFSFTKSPSSLHDRSAQQIIQYMRKQDIHNAMC